MKKSFIPIYRLRPPRSAAWRGWGIKRKLCMVQTKMPVIFKKKSSIKNMFVHRSETMFMRFQKDIHGIQKMLYQLRDFRPSLYTNLCLCPP
jgi:hypothetical protein